MRKLEGAYLGEGRPIIGGHSQDRCGGPFSGRENNKPSDKGVVVGSNNSVRTTGWDSVERGKVKINAVTASRLLHYMCVAVACTAIINLIISIY